MQEDFAHAYILSVREKDPGIGGVKLWYMYKRDFQGGKPLGRDRFEDVIDKYNLKVRKKVRKPRITDSFHGLPVYPNLVRSFIPLLPNMLWVADITYITIITEDGQRFFCYASFIMDAYTKEIVGWSVGPTLETVYPLQALRMAISRLEGKDLKSIDLIHHSDKGVQYASHEYLCLLQSMGIKVSMTDTGDPKDNAQAERINNTMKNELLKGEQFRSLEEAHRAVEKAVHFYNNERPHMSLDMMTPTQAAHCAGELKKHWTSYREKAIRESIQGAQGSCAPNGRDVQYGKDSSAFDICKDKQGPTGSLHISPANASGGLTEIKTFLQPTQTEDLPPPNHISLS